jgi:hypothetical protein
MLMDAIFGASSFRNEIIWKRSHAHSDSRQGSQHFGRVTDTILFYVKGEQATWHVEYVPYDQEYLDRDYRRVDPDGRRYRIDNIQGPGGAAKGNLLYEVMGVNSSSWRGSASDRRDRCGSAASRARALMHRAPATSGASRSFGAR